MAKYLDQTGLTYFWNKIKNFIRGYVVLDNGTITIGSNSITPVEQEAGKGLSDENYTSAEKTKLSGIASGAEVNQNAFSNVKVGSSTIEADGKTDTVEFVAGTNITLTPDTTNDKITVSVNGIADGAEVNQYAFSNVKVGSTTIASDTKTDTLELVAGSNITLTPDATNDKVTIAVNNIADGAEVNQNAFSNIKVGSATVAADTKTDTVEFVGGGVLSITGDTTNDKVTFTIDTDLSNYNNSNSQFITLADVPEGAAPYTSNPEMDGTASPGSSNLYAKGDHVHPSDTTKANKSEMTIVAGTGANADKTTITLKTGTSATVLTTHQNISGKADKSSTVSNVVYDTTNHKITKTINGTTSDVVTAATVVTDGGGILTTQKGVANGVCPLDNTAKIDAQYLPSYVDDVIEAYARSGQTELSQNWLAVGSASGTVITPETGKIYVLMNSSTNYEANSQFRWGGTSYVRLNDSGCSAMTTTEIDAATDQTPNPS